MKAEWAERLLFPHCISAAFDRIGGRELNGELNVTRKALEAWELF